MNKVNYPFWVVVNKEISDHVKSWRFIYGAQNEAYKTIY